MNKFEEMNYNSDAIISTDIDVYLLAQGYTKEENKFHKYYYKAGGNTTKVTIKQDSVYLYIEDSGGFFVNDNYIEMDEEVVQELDSFKEYINEVFEMNIS